MLTLNDVRKALTKAGCEKLPKGTKLISPWAPEKSCDLVEDTQDAFQEMVSGTFEVVSDVSSLEGIIREEMLRKIGLDMPNDEEECDAIIDELCNDNITFEEFWRIPKKLHKKCNLEMSVLLKEK